MTIISTIREQFPRPRRCESCRLWALDDRHTCPPPPADLQDPIRPSLSQGGVQDVRWAQDLLNEDILRAGGGRALGARGRVDATHTHTHTHTQEKQDD